ncbi:MAG TPA: hypothetical protein VF521_11820 [Pyrinomonadaceae bacterium]
MRVYVKDPNKPNSNILGWYEAQPGMKTLSGCTIKKVFADKVTLARPDETEVTVNTAGISPAVAHEHGWGSLADLLDRMQMLCKHKEDFAEWAERNKAKIEALDPDDRDELRAEIAFQIKHRGARPTEPIFHADRTAPPKPAAPPRRYFLITKPGRSHNTVGVFAREEAGTGTIYLTIPNGDVLGFGRGEVEEGGYSDAFEEQKAAHVAKLKERQYKPPASAEKGYLEELADLETPAAVERWRLQIKVDEGDRGKPWPDVMKRRLDGAADVRLRAIEEAARREGFRLIDSHSLGYVRVETRHARRGEVARVTHRDGGSVSVVFYDEEISVFLAGQWSESTREEYQHQLESWLHSETDARRRVKIVVALGAAPGLDLYLVSRFGECDTAGKVNYLLRIYDPSISRLGEEERAAVLKAAADRLEALKVTDINTKRGARAPQKATATKTKKGTRTA